MDPALVEKYRRIVVGALKKIEDINDDTSVLASSEATKIERVPGRVKVDDDTLTALKSLRKDVGDLIRIIVDAQNEYDRLDIEVDDLDIEVGG